jgi:hypothetical protein
VVVLKRNIAITGLYAANSRRSDILFDHRGEGGMVIKEPIGGTVVHIHVNLYILIVVVFHVITHNFTVSGRIRIMNDDTE